MSFTIRSKHPICLAVVLSSVTLMSACGAGGRSSSITASGVESVSDGRVNVSLEKESNLSVSNARVGLVAFATGINDRKGQVVAVAGIADNPEVGSPVTEGRVTYNTRYNYIVLDNTNRTDNFINADQGTRRFNGRTTLTADYSAGTLTGSSSDLRVNGQISGQEVSGTARVDYNVRGGFLGTKTLSGRMNTTLDGRIGSTGVIATFHGTDSNTAVAGGLVGEAN